MLVLLENFIAQSAPFAAFSSAIEIGVGANFLFSALFKVGSFSGLSVHRLGAREKMRILTAMAETSNFDGVQFEAYIDGLVAKYRKLIYSINCAAAVWAFVVAAIGVIALIAMPYYPNFPVSGDLAVKAGLIGYGAIPTGILTALLLHIIAMTHMFLLQRRHNVVMNYFRPLPTIKKARENLRAKSRKPKKTDQ